MISTELLGTKQTKLAIMLATVVFPTRLEYAATTNL